MHSFVISKNVKWCHLIWPTLYTQDHKFTRLQANHGSGAVLWAFHKLQPKTQNSPEVTSALQKLWDDLPQTTLYK